MESCVRSYENYRTARLIECRQIEIMTKTIAGQLGIFATIVILGILALVATQQYTSHQLRVNGPLYQEIVTGKDLLADIAPSQMNGFHQSDQQSILFHYHLYDHSLRPKNRNQEKFY